MSDDTLAMIIVERMVTVFEYIAASYVQRNILRW